MTISTTTSTVTYQGNGATTNFSFSFVPDSPSDIEVFYTDSNGTVTELVGTQYTLVINPIPVGGLWATGGYVVYPISGSPISAGTYLTITRAVPYTQNISINNQGAFYPQAVEQALDVLELQIQQLDTDLEYTLRFPTTDITPPNILPVASLRANGLLGFNSQGQPIIVPDSGGVIPTPVSSANPRVVVTTGTAVIPVLTTDSLGGVSIYQSSTPHTTLQLPGGYGPYPVFDSSLNAGSFPITILPPAGVTIMGQSSYLLAFNGQGVSFYYDGIQYLAL